MARKAAFTVPSLEEMEQTDQQVISTYATVKDGISKSLSAISANAHTESTTTASVARSTSNLQATKECNTNPSRTTKLPTVPSVEYVVPKSAGIIGDNRKPVGVKTVPIISLGNHQSTLPASASNTPSGNSQPVVAVTTSGKTNAIIVSARQKGNPVLKCIRNVPWEFGDIVPDYQLGQTSCALFLSTRYHLLYPAYIHERLKQLGHSFHLRALLMLIDVKDPHHALKEVAKMCILADCSLILAFTVEEAGRYLETFKSFEKKPPDLIMEKTEGNFLSQVTDVFTSARKINKTDAMTLLSTFGTVKGVVESSQDELSLCPGFGPQKAQRLHRLVHEPFIKVKKTKGSQLTDEAAVQPSSSAGATGGVDDTRTKTNRENVTALEKV